jgi:hypothetical protein
MMSVWLDPLKAKAMTHPPECAGLYLHSVG